MLAILYFEDGAAWCASAPASLGWYYLYLSCLGVLRLPFVFCVHESKRRQNNICYVATFKPVNNNLLYRHDLKIRRLHFFWRNKVLRFLKYLRRNVGWRKCWSDKKRNQLITQAVPLLVLSRDIPVHSYLDMWCLSCLSQPVHGQPGAGQEAVHGGLGQALVVRIDFRLKEDPQILNWRHLQEVLEFQPCKKRWHRSWVGDLEENLHAW